MNNLEGKVAVITGASKGIGKGIAKALASQGVCVAINYNSDKTAADQLVEELKSKDYQAMAFQADVSNKTDVTNMFNQIKSAIGNIDILVNNAGVYHFEPIETVTVDEFQRQMNTNVLGSMLCSQEALSHFGDKGGSIINISSVATTRPTAYTSLYTATKSAIDGFTQSLAKELGPRNIRVNAILPGLVETEGTHTIGTIGSESEANFVTMTPMGRVGQPNDIAQVVSFLATSNAQWITGQKIEVTGGF
ncbi:SDR family NAD(P)-dependent oxidoreductase [Flammeovirga agarivorans]|uniref:Glucose 1-dehydrogenase n=1 Tax=Flammeovirga agarivorans TaxID=2726742 RepID=A0A7X8SJS1_9BACT|nr:glucose 1-dehydrogenase [Flammeovirga agarivorans]NLR91422.1 glucose 1-dehydrogenase [Flammeovirga agarivorans]